MSDRSKAYYETFAEQVIEALEKGTAPWQKPWKENGPTTPYNPETGTVYRGVNQLSLSMYPGADVDPRFITFRNAMDRGYKIKKGSKSQLIVHWSFSREVPERDAEGNFVQDENGRQKMARVALERPRVNFANVFHASQIEGMPELVTPERTWEPSERGEAILVNSGADIRHDQVGRAFFKSSTDTIHLPPKGAFSSERDYYATALHELAHWTGDKKRLNRLGQHPKGSPEYAREELRAELASWMVGAETGIGHTPARHASYVESWVKTLRNDPYEIVRAAQAAEQIKAVLLGFEQGQSIEHTLQSRPDRATTSLPPHTEKNPPLTNFSFSSPNPIHSKVPEMTMQKTYLAVPFDEKDDAKEAGARWDGREKLWFAPKDSDLRTFSRWLPKKQVNSRISPEQEFAAAIVAAGLDIRGELPIMDGKLHRVPLVDKPKGRDGAYMGVLDGRPAGFIQNHVTGVKINWKASGYALSAEEKEALKLEGAQRREAREQERREARDKAAKRAFARWKNAVGWAPDDQRYLQDKGVKSFGVKVDDRGDLLIPLRDTDGRIHSMQTINESGKFFEKGGQKRGLFHVVGRGNQQNSVTTICIAEGYATAATAHMATGVPVACAFDAGNLEAVAKALHAAHPDRQLILLADDDHKQDNNPGVTKAQQAAKTVGGQCVIPEFSAAEKARGLTDFNDLHQSRGLQAVSQALSPALDRAKRLAQSKSPEALER